MSFYTDMAATAKELIAEYGTDVTLRFNSGVYSPVTGTKTTSNTDTATKGIFTKINQRLREDFSLLASDKVLVLISDVAPTKDCKILIGAEYWQCVDFKEIKPASTTIVFFVQVRK